LANFDTITWSKERGLALSNPQKLIRTLCLERETGLEPATTCLEAVLNGFPPFTPKLPSKSEADTLPGRRSQQDAPCNIISLTLLICKCKKCDVGVTSLGY